MPLLSQSSLLNTVRLIWSKRILFNTFWLFMCNEKSIYKKWNYDPSILPNVHCWLNLAAYLRLSNCCSLFCMIEANSLHLEVASLMLPCWCCQLKSLGYIMEAQSLRSPCLDGHIKALLKLLKGYLIEGATFFHLFSFLFSFFIVVYFSHWRSTWI